MIETSLADLLGAPVNPTSRVIERVDKFAGVELVSVVQYVSWVVVYHGADTYLVAGIFKALCQELLDVLL